MLRCAREARRFEGGLDDEAPDEKAIVRKN
jgi:hypothetical protein